MAMKFISSWCSVVMAAALCFCFPTAARAEMVLMTCTGTTTLQYSPGLTFTPTLNSYAVNAVMAPCVGIPVGVSSANYSASGSEVLSCEVITSTVTKPPYTFHWGDGTQSTTQTDTVVIQRPLGQIVRIDTGHVVSGRFLGATVVKTMTLLQTDLDACLTTGVTSTGGPVVLTVTGI